MSVAKKGKRGHFMKRSTTKRRWTVADRPIASEVLTLPGLETRARELAASQTLRRSTWLGSRRFRAGVLVHARIVRDAYRTLSAAVEAEESVDPAAEWLLDNYHVVESACVDVRRDLPRRYVSSLPKVGSSQEEEVPRVIAMARELIHHTDAHLDLQRLTRFVVAFQTQTPLTIGELWAWPSATKAVLIERIVAFSEEILESRLSRLEADVLFSELEHVNPEGEVPDLVAGREPAFVVQILQRLREYGSPAWPLRGRLEETLSKGELTAEEIVRLEHRRQATAQAGMGNAISSLRLVSSLDWSRFFEKVSLVEHTLQRDPAAAYGRMTFRSRDSYRRAVEEIADRTGEGEVRVASRAVDLARRAMSEGVPDERESHVGFYLVDRGRRVLERTEDARPPLRARARALLLRFAAPAYLGALLVATLLLAGGAAAVIGGGAFRAWMLILLLVPSSELAIGLVQQLFARLVPPRPLPRLDFGEGVPEAGRTMVIVPTLLTSVEAVRSLAADLEVLALGNQDPRVHFAILGDFADALVPEVPEDAAILAAAREELEALWQRHGADRFFFFHRARLWNPGEGCWMGWERKRGKIEEFNRLVGGAHDTSYTTQWGDLRVLPGIRYCITLDRDTRLPRGAARELIGTILHPLNRARIDPALGRVVEGYGVLQPRVSVSLPSASASWFARLSAGNTGVDPYTTAVSDTYQDLFGEGIFAGKGLYDVHVFTQVLEGRVPENAILSHDLFEGLFARAALVSDVELVDDYPPGVLPHARRQRRWVRGDWQLLSWLFPWVPSRDGWRRNHFSAIARWKILDNLRRSLVPAAVVVLFLASWTVLPGSPWAWTAFTLATMATPLVPFVSRVIRGPRQERSIAFLRGVLEELGRGAAQTALSAVLVLYHAIELLDAVGVTIVRLFVTKRRLLEWETAARSATLFSHGSLARHQLEMASSTIPAALVALTLALTNRAAMPAAAPILASWLLAPFIAWAASRQTPRPVVQLTEEDERFVREMARRTFEYFETFVTAENHWLPPDNVQEAPIEEIANRTSPTNIGLSLLSVLAAQDLGFIDEAGALQRIGRTLDGIERLERYEGHLLNWYDTKTLAPLRPRYVSTVDSGNLAASLIALAAGLRARSRVASGTERSSEANETDGAGVLGAERLADRCLRLALGMNFRFLFDSQRMLFSIGYRLADAEGPGRLDEGYYDLLASEARIASFVAIAKGDVPQAHWFHLGRALVSARGNMALVSWGASMFEYLMPLLLLRTYPGTLVDRSCRAAVRQQRSYAREIGIPWGISESAYAFVDHAGRYQYRAFGVPGIGLKRDLGDHVVVSPYSSALAVLVDPLAAIRNLRRLEGLGMAGRFGFYEAIDYGTKRPSREREAGAPESREPRIVRAFFAHHQAMSLVAFANLLEGFSMVERFHADPRIQASELLLQERVPRAPSVTQPRPPIGPVVTRETTVSAARRFRSPEAKTPRSAFYSNGRYTVVVTSSGGGASLYRELSVTRLHEDETRDLGGQYLYLRDVRSGLVWSPTRQPCSSSPDRYLAAFDPEKAVFRCSQEGIDSMLEIGVSPEDDVEIRRLFLSNRTTHVRDIELTSYVDLSMNRPADDLAHPAFGKLFIETEFLPDASALLARRRPRAPEDPELWVLHGLAVEGRQQEPVEWETNRVSFLGRGRDVGDPVALDGRPLAGGVGQVLDPCLSLRTRIRLAPGGSARFVFTTGMTTSAKDARAWASKYRDPRAATRALTLGFTHVQSELRHLGIGADDAQLFQRLASRTMFLDRSMGSREVPGVATLGQAGLWRLGISGDFPILLVQVFEEAHLRLLTKALKAHQYWRLKGMPADVVLLAEEAAGYRDELHAQCEARIEGVETAGWKGRPGGIHLVRGAQISAAERVLLLSVARAVLDGRRGDLETQFDAVLPAPPLPPSFVPSEKPAAFRDRPIDAPARRFANELGGFSEDGRSYVIVLSGNAETPLPWVNVLANPSFGSIVSASGAAFTWAFNSRENRLTPFANDPVTDPTAEALFLRDEDTGEFWTATPGPGKRDPAVRWIITHGMGSTRFQHASHGFEHTLDVAVHPDDPVKHLVLSLDNRSDRRRRIAVYMTVDWALGPPRRGERLHIVTERHPKHPAVLATNGYNTLHGEQVAFLASSEPVLSATGDRTELLGRCGSLAEPAALRRTRLAERFGAGLDACAALQAIVEIPAGASRSVSFVLGCGRDRATAEVLLERHASTAAGENARDLARDRWRGIVDRLTVATPDDSFDTLMNGWLSYQTLSSRLWARSGYFQPGGAYGFRDQLQDVLALLPIWPEITREHLVRAAGRQFEEGDVQHWWHPEDGRGLRSRCSDDRLWLPYAVSEYVRATGDRGVLDEAVPFLAAPLLAEGQLESYGVPTHTEGTGTLFEHCVRAIDRSLSFGPRGLPLIGSGDWNDGMNRLGIEGRGESVWLGWFLHDVLMRMAPLAEERGEAGRADSYRTEAVRLAVRLELEWDGQWYRRAIADDGTPIGSAQGEECRIDSLSQSWAVLSGAAQPNRAQHAMDAVRAQLIRRPTGVILLLAPPFDRSPIEPGYIKGYPPGIRENGGQYTHAAIWVAMAIAALGNGEEAVELFHLLNPINRTRTRAGADRYRLEPYVLAGDVYGPSAHEGRGGWSWYTGSAGWMFRLGLESILGFRLRGTSFALRPCMPRAWSLATMTWQFRNTRYEIRLERVDDAAHPPHATLDGERVDVNSIPLRDDGKTHVVRVVLAEEK